MNGDVRTEHDLLGAVPVDAAALYGVHTVRARDNFHLTGLPVHGELVRAFGTVKLAAALTNRDLGAWAADPAKADAIERACRELADGLHDDAVIVERLQGGAGTSHQHERQRGASPTAPWSCWASRPAPTSASRRSTTSICTSPPTTPIPTALQLAAIRLLHDLEEQVVALQEAFQVKEKEFAHVVKVGRTQLQDAVLTTLGREMGAYAEAINRDRWRIYKCEERLRVVNLGGTAIGTGFGGAAAVHLPRGRRAARADRHRLRPRREPGGGHPERRRLRRGLGHPEGPRRLAAEDLLRPAPAVVAAPKPAWARSACRPRQAGSSIMPGKVNPVIPEAVSQAAMMVMGYDATIAQAAAAGSLELNPFLPLVAACLLESLLLLQRACLMLRRSCVEGIEADEAACRRHVEASTAAATALVPVLGYDAACEVVKAATESGATVRTAAVDGGFVPPRDSMS